MATLIYAQSGSFYTSVATDDVKAAIDRGEFIPVWWFSAWGQRFSERAWFAPDTVQMIRSESDDG